MKTEKYFNSKQTEKLRFPLYPMYVWILITRLAAYIQLITKLTPLIRYINLWKFIIWGFHSNYLCFLAQQTLFNNELIMHCMFYLYMLHIHMIRLSNAYAADNIKVTSPSMVDIAKWTFLPTLIVSHYSAMRMMIISIPSRPNEKISPLLGIIIIDKGDFSLYFSHKIMFTLSHN